MATSDDFYVLQINFDGWGRALTKNKAKVLSQNPPKSAIYGNFFKYGVAEKCHATIHTHTHFLHFFLNFTALCCEPAWQITQLMNETGLSKKAFTPSRVESDVKKKSDMPRPSQIVMLNPNFPNFKLSEVEHR